MANHRAAALLLITSLFVAVVISGADARPTVHPNKTAAVRGANVRHTGSNTRLTVRRDTHGLGYTTNVAALAVPEHEPEPKKPEEHKKPKNPKPDPEPEREPESELTCHKVHGVKEGETCCSVREGAELTEDRFLDFNPNLCCEKLFVGQWVCLEATYSCHEATSGCHH